MTSREWSVYWTKEVMGWPEVWDDTVAKINQMIHDMAALETKLRKTVKKPPRKKT